MKMKEVTFLFILCVSLSSLEAAIWLQIQSVNFIPEPDRSIYSHNLQKYKIVESAPPEFML